ncbi:helix-turn-helix transcriptional regulator [Peribacillus loiseleuriae]|uniref:helix-turn-helix transcriptional regulator n=1 Tax=Peribacillus loiseleuriae TaxID=1679170 RepID=UPI0006710FEB|nr:helix-turn-helix transcriptional regulator [Peribacillus loiseleuriae]
MDIIGQRLKWLREKKRYGQKEVAGNIGLTTSGYQKMEYGEANPKVDTLIKISQFYNESSDFLLGLSDHTRKLQEIDEKLRFLIGDLKITEKEFLDVYFNEKVSEDAKNDLAKRVSKLKREVDYYQEEYSRKIVKIPNINLSNNSILKDRVPLEIFIIEEKSSGNWFITLEDNRCEQLARMTEENTKEKAIEFAEMIKEKNGIEYTVEEESYLDMSENWD